MAKNHLFPAIALLMLVAGGLSPIPAQTVVASESNFAYLRHVMQAGELERQFIQKIKERYLGKEADVRLVEGNLTVAPGETIDRDVLVIQGNADIAGTILGKLLVIEGNILLRRTARIMDDVVCVNGEIHRNAGAEILGELIEASFRQPSIQQKERPKEEQEKTGPAHGYREWKEKPKRRWRRKAAWTHFKRPDLDQSPILWRYNRVEGLFLGINVPPAWPAGRPVDFDLNGHLGYGFASKTWRYRLNAELAFQAGYRLAVGATLFDLTETEDRWIIPTEENSLAALLIREDFRDYFQRRGYGFYLENRVYSIMRFKAGYYLEQYTPLTRRTNWSVFGGDKQFRENPLYDAGRSNVLRLGMTLDSRNHQTVPTRGVLFKILTEFSRPEFGSELDYDRLIVDFRTYVPVKPGERLNIRLRAASSRGKLPAQFRYYLGGLSTLRAMDYKSLAGNRMILANIEYFLGSKSYRLRHHDVLSSIDMVLFLDVGYAWDQQPSTDLLTGFNGLKWKHLRANVGFALTDEDGRIRLNFARRIDGGPRNVVVTFRLNRPF